MNIYIDQNTLKNARRVIELRAQYSASITAKTDEEIQKIFELRDQIEELERQLGMDLIWKIAAADADTKIAG